MASEKEKNYFDMFVVSTEYNCKIAKKLKEFITGFKNVKDMEKAVLDIHKIEHEADVYFHGIYEQLNKSFITPIEREDILLLAQSIDDVSDAIEEVAYALYCLNITELKPEIIPFVDLIEKSCSDLLIAVTEFKKFKKSKVLSEKILDVNIVEEEGDKLYHRMLRELFTKPADVLEIMKWREIYEKLEHCLDSCENVADILDGIVLKNS